MASAGREVEHRAVFRDDDVEAREIAGDPPQIGQPAAGDEDDGDAVLPGLGDRFAHAGIEDAVDSNRPVIVEGEHG